VVRFIGGWIRVLLEQPLLDGGDTGGQWRFQALTVRIGRQVP
jgi:hypothetical protein